MLEQKADRGTSHRWLCSEPFGGRLPVPWKQLIQVLDIVVVDPTKHVGQPSLRIDVIEPAGLDQRFITAARSPPRSEPANSHDFLPSAMPRSARSAAFQHHRDAGHLRTL